MKKYDYQEVKLVAHKDEEAGRLFVYALLGGVEVPVAAHKLGHYAHLLEADAKKVEAELASSPTASSPSAPQAAAEPHEPGTPSPTAPSPSTAPTQ